MGTIANFQTNPDLWFSAYLKPSLKPSLFDAVLSPDPWIHRKQERLLGAENVVEVTVTVVEAYPADEVWSSHQMHILYSVQMI